MTLSNGECIERVADMAITASDDFDSFGSGRIWRSDGDHSIHSEYWLQNIPTLRHQELDLANVLSRDTAKLNLGRARRRNTTAEHERR